MSKKLSPQLCTDGKADTATRAVVATFGASLLHLARPYLADLEKTNEMAKEPSRDRSRSPRRNGAAVASTRSRSLSPSKRVPQQQQQPAQPTAVAPIDAFKPAADDDPWPEHVAPVQVDVPAVKKTSNRLWKNGVDIGGDTFALDGVVGQTIVAVLNCDNETYDGCAGLLLGNGKAVWFERDGEGNGAGQARIDCEGRGPGLFRSY